MGHEFSNNFLPSCMTARSYGIHIEDDPNSICLLRVYSLVNKRRQEERPRMKFCSKVISFSLSPPGIASPFSSSPSGYPHKYTASCTEFYTLDALIILLKSFSPIILGDLCGQGNLFISTCPAPKTIPDIEPSRRVGLDGWTGSEGAV